MTTLMQKPVSTPWFTTSKPNPQARLRLFCFPYAGGGSRIFRTWSDNLPDSVEVCLVHLPGREARMTERPFDRLTPLVATMARYILPFADKPFAFFGHSMGALICFELAREMRRRYGLHPDHLFASGRTAPQVPFIARLHDLPEKEFLDELSRLNGTPREVLLNYELMQLMMPVLRADFAMNETYAYINEPPLDCPITAFSGLEDREVTLEDVSAWRLQTGAAFSSYTFAGDHFFLHTCETLLLRVLSECLERLTGDEAVNLG